MVYDLCLKYFNVLTEAFSTIVDTHTLGENTISCQSQVHNSEQTLKKVQPPTKLPSGYSTKKFLSRRKRKNYYILTIQQWFSLKGTDLIKIQMKSIRRSRSICYVSYVVIFAYSPCYRSTSTSVQYSVEHVINFC